MISWKDASDSDKILFTAISKIFNNNQCLLSFFFHPFQARLSQSCQKIKQNAKAFGSGEELLIRIALDVWSGEGGISFNEIYQKLDTGHFFKVMEILIELRDETPRFKICQLKRDSFSANSAN